MFIVFGDLHVTYKQFVKRNNKDVPVGPEVNVILDKCVLLIKKVNEDWVVVEQIQGQLNKKIKKHLTESQRILKVKAVIYNNIKSRPVYQYQTFRTDFAVEFANKIKS